MTDVYAHFKLTPAQIAEIKASKELPRVLAPRFGVSKSTIRRYQRPQDDGACERQLYRRVQEREAGRRARAQREIELRRRLRAEVAAITWREVA